MLDKYDLYERCAQAPARDARFLRAIHGGSPRTLGEDFSGGGAIARKWVELCPDARAVTVDLDPEPLTRLRGVKGITVVCDDVRRAGHKADVIADLNFSICELHDRRDLVAYFAHTRARLRAKGVIVCDLYGGSDCYFTGTITQRLVGPSGERIVYEWEQRHADPLTARVVNAMHFRVSPPKSTKPKPAARARRPHANPSKRESLASPPAGTPIDSTFRAYSIRDAFVYRWRLWTVPELREAMIEAGYRTTQVYPRFAEATDTDGNLYVSPVSDPAELGDSYSVYVVGRI